ncbi:30S ribosomal protein S11 [Candidatus Uhrbacteria bacterium]|nr:30S ribosomal protein S11 [Candidatus Uhrbacteria bacterium]
MSDDVKNSEKASAPVKKVAPAKEKLRRQVLRGHAYVQATYNNTIIALADPNGNVLAWSTAGHLGFSGPKKATPYAAAQIVRDLVEKVKPYGMREVFVFVKGVGSGRESAIRTFNAAGFQVVGIKDITPIPHNGPRAPKPRRV